MSENLFEPVMLVADIIGSDEYPDINGRISFKKKLEGVLVTAEIFGLPKSNAICDRKIFALHIHEGKFCSGNINEPFANTGTHFNPDKCEHPNHAGDLPPLFGNNGYAYISVYTDRFKLSEIIDKTVIIHSMPDDFNSQPAGNSGKKIACGEIKII